jgi:hypothetical protein
MSLADVRLSQLLRIYIDGTPLDLASRLLPATTWLRFSLLSHIHLHAKSQQRFAGKKIDISSRRIGKKVLSGIIDSVASAVARLTWRHGHTEWSDYYDSTNYSTRAITHKKQLVSDYLDRISPPSVWDLGANTGLFSRIAGSKNIATISFDSDPAVVEHSYLECGSRNETLILPLLLDLTNPSPGIGWDNMERSSLADRGPAGALLALALVHHLVISNNVPFGRLAEFFGRLSSSLIVEFVPKHDSQVQRLLSTRADIFPEYTQDAFERALQGYFVIEDRRKIEDSERSLYYMRRKPVLN